MNFDDCLSEPEGLPMFYEKVQESSSIMWKSNGGEEDGRGQAGEAKAKMDPAVEVV